MEDKQKFEPMGTKIAPWAAVVWNAVCEALGTDTYHMLQQFIYAMIRSASEQHNKTPEVQRLMDALDLDVGWQNAINLCAPNGKQSIAQMILIVEQEGKKGFGVYMLDKPWMDQCKQTENVDDIFERMTEVIFKRLYMKLRALAEYLGTKSQRELLETLIDAHHLTLFDEELKETGPNVGDMADNGRVYGYGKKTKGLQHRTPDSVARDQRIKFGEYDATTTDTGDDITDEDLEQALGFRPFTSEW